MGQPGLSGKGRQVPACGGPGVSSLPFLEGIFEMPLNSLYTSLPNPPEGSKEKRGSWRVEDIPGNSLNTTSK